MRSPYKANCVSTRLTESGAGEQLDESPLVAQTQQEASTGISSKRLSSEVPVVERSYRKKPKGLIPPNLALATLKSKLQAGEHDAYPELDFLALQIFGVDKHTQLSEQQLDIFLRSICPTILTLLGLPFSSGTALLQQYLKEGYNEQQLSQKLSVHVLAFEYLQLGNDNANGHFYPFAVAPHLFERHKRGTNAHKLDMPQDASALRTSMHFTQMDAREKVEAETCITSIRDNINAVVLDLHQNMYVLHKALECHKSSTRLANTVSVPILTIKTINKSGDNNKATMVFRHIKNSDEQHNVIKCSTDSQEITDQFKNHKKLKDVSAKLPWVEGGGSVIVPQVLDHGSYTIVMKNGGKSLDMHNIAVDTVEQQIAFRRRLLEALVKDKLVVDKVGDAGLDGKPSNRTVEDWKDLSKPLYFIDLVSRMSTILYQSPEERSRQLAFSKALEAYFHTAITFVELLFGALIEAHLLARENATKEWDTKGLLGHNSETNQQFLDPRKIVTRPRNIPDTDIMKSIVAALEELLSVSPKARYRALMCRSCSKRRIWT